MGKKKDKKDKKKKDKKKKEKKEKKKKETKKKKKQASSGSSSDSDSGSSSSSGEAKQQKKKSKKEEKEGEMLFADPRRSSNGEILFAAPKRTMAELAPPEDGIQRFEYLADETGPLGVRFSGGFPPLILAVLPDSHAARKSIPVNFEVHAVNGNPLVPQNLEVVMAGLKARPVILDVRPTGWKPTEIAKEIALKKRKDENELRAIMEIEEKRRDQVTEDKAEQNRQDAELQKERQAQEKIANDKLLKRAREQAAEKRGKEEEWEKVLNQDSPALRKAAADIMAAPYGGPAIKIEGMEGAKLPLRLLTRRKEVAWFWAGEIQELIGGGSIDPKDSWLEN